MNGDNRKQPDTVEGQSGCPELVHSGLEHPQDWSTQVWLPLGWLPSGPVASGLVQG